MNILEGKSGYRDGGGQRSAHTAGGVAKGMATVGKYQCLSGKGSACNAGDAVSIPGSGRPLGKSMATHSSILAWEIAWSEEPGGLQSLGSQRVGHG